VVEIEGAGQSGTGVDDRRGAVVVGRSCSCGQKSATDALVIAFAVVMSDVFTNKMSQMGFAKDNEIVQALIPVVSTFSSRCDQAAARW
jgi:hypothetical protein